MKSYYDGQVVEFKVPTISNRIYDGQVVGIANTGFPLLGQGILIQHGYSELKTELYPFSTLVIFENDILGTEEYERAEKVRQAAYLDTRFVSNSHV